jgi:hypothetical protein
MCETTRGSPNPQRLSNGSGNIDLIKKDKEKKIKERRSNLSKLQKGLAEAKKMYEEKLKKNKQFQQENEVRILNNLKNLAENLKQKALIGDEMRREIEYMKLKINNGKKRPQSTLIGNSKPSLDQSSVNGTKKGFMGFVKSIFK